MIIISIITPCKRLENIPVIFSNLRSCTSNFLKIHWFPIFDLSEKEKFLFWEKRLNYLGTERKEFSITPILSHIENAIAGHAHRNIALEKIKKEYKDCWIYNVDDDNIIMLDLILYFLKNEKDLESYAGILVSQILKDGKLRLIADKDKVVVCHVDTAQLVFKLKFLNDLKFIENDYCADGHFINAFYEQNNRNVYIEQNPLCYYNYLKDKTWI